VLQALRIPDFRRLWAGSLISSLGSWLLVLAVPAHILMATGSLRDTGLALAAEYLPLLLLGPVAGVVADRCDRRRLIITANLSCAGAVAVMLAGTSPGRYWVLYAALVAENCGAVLYAAALQAHTPAIVGTGPLLSSANALNSLSSGTVRLIGGPAGAILLTACGIKWLICADVLSYLVSAAAVFLTSRTGGQHPYCKTTISGVARDLIHGIHVLRAQPLARTLLPVTVIFLTANASLSAVLIPLGIQRLGGSEHTGYLLSSLGAGFLIGAPVIRPLLDRAQTRNLLTASLTATAAAYFLLFTSTSLATALPAAATVGLSGSMSLVIPQTAMQRVIPNTALGRVSAVFLTCEAAATLTGAVAGPFLAQAAHLIAVATAASIGTLFAATLAYLIVPRGRSGPGPASLVVLHQPAQFQRGTGGQDLGRGVVPPGGCWNPRGWCTGSLAWVTTSQSASDPSDLPVPGAGDRLVVGQDLGTVEPQGLDHRRVAQHEELRGLDGLVVHRAPARDGQGVAPPPAEGHPVDDGPPAAGKDHDDAAAHGPRGRGPQPGRELPHRAAHGRHGVAAVDRIDEAQLGVAAPGGRGHVGQAARGVLPPVDHERRMPVGIRPDAGQQPRVGVQGGAARLDRRARGVEVLGARGLEEACVQDVHQRQVEPVEPDHRLVGAAVMLVPGHARRQHEVAGGHRTRLAVHRGPDAAALQDEPDGRRRVPVRGRALLRVEVLHGPPQGGGGER